MKARPQWINEGKSKILMQMTLARSTHLPDVPTIKELVRNDLDREVTVTGTVVRATFAEPQQHRQEREALAAVGDRVGLAADGADADAADREDAGLDRAAAHQFDDLGHVDLVVEIRGIFDGEMRHGRLAQVRQPK